MPLYPAIPNPDTSPESLRDTILALKEAVELLTGQRGEVAATQVTTSDQVMERLIEFEDHTHVIDNTKLADMPATRVKARGTASTGDPEDIAIGNGLELDATSLRSKQQMSITADGSGLKLTNDESSPGNSEYYGTNGSGTKGYYALPSALTLVETLAASGASVTSAAIATAYKVFFLAFDSVSHDNGASQTLRVEISTDSGSSYSSAQAITSSLSGASSWTLTAHIYNANQTAKMVIAPSSATGAVSATVSRANAVTHLRFSWSAGNFDAGSVYIFGL